MISPLLANVYLHYVFDLWAERWRRREATGDMIIVRYADDIIVGFEHETDARRFWDAMRERLEEYCAVASSGQDPADRVRPLRGGPRERRGLGKPETFNFLGFTFICGKSRRGSFELKRKTRRDRMRAKLQGNQGGDAAANASARSPNREMAEASRHRLLQLPRGADEQSRTHTRSVTMSPISGDARSGGAARRIG